jgi:Protein of unknown function (DUF3592)
MFFRFVNLISALGAAGIVAYCVAVVVRYRGSSSWPITSGRIESYDGPTYMNTGAGVCFASVRYSYSVGACDYRGSWLSPQLRSQAALNDFLEKELPVGKLVEVRYKPTAPGRSELANPPELVPEEIIQQTKFSEL